MSDWRTGVYLTTAQVEQDPEYSLRLRDEIGLTTVVLSFSGTLPEEVTELSPFPQVPPTDDQLTDLVLRHMDGGPVDPREFDRAAASVGPGVGATGDDDGFRRAVDGLKEQGLEVWLCGSSWTIRRLMFCPSRASVTAWFEAVYSHWAGAYGVDGLDITHARFPMGSFPLGLFGCTCDHCAVAASRLGYDMEEMIAALRQSRARLRQLDGKRLGEVVRMGVGFFDIIQALDVQPGLISWLRFRAELLIGALTRFRRAAKAANPEIFFGGDTFPASMSLTVGHDLVRWGEFADFASPLVSHISAFTCNTLTEWARFLQSEIGDSLSTADALATIYRFTGYDGIGLPESYEGFGDAHELAQRVPVADLVLRDLAKTKLHLPQDLPSYPILHGTGWPRPAIDRIVTEARRLGHDGIIWQGTDELMNSTPASIRGT